MGSGNLLRVVMASMIIIAIMIIFLIKLGIRGRHPNPSQRTYYSSITDIQSTLAFHIQTPSVIPTGFKFAGVKKQVKFYAGAFDKIAAYGTPDSKNGYGLLTCSNEHRCGVRLINDRRVDKYRLPQDHYIELISINGHRLDFDQQRKIANLPPDERHKVEMKTPSIVTLMASNPPLKLTVKDDDQIEKTVVMHEKITYTLKDGDSHPKSDYAACLFYNNDKRRLVIAESKFYANSFYNLTFRYSLEKHIHREIVDGQSIVFTGNA